MRVVHLLGGIGRSAGGVWTSVEGLHLSLGRHGIESYVLGVGDTETKNSNPYNTQIFLVNRLGPRSFGYSTEARKILESVRPDIIHIHGLWMYPSVLGSWSKEKMNIDHVVSPHGMLDEWAIRNSAWKKRLAGFLYEQANIKSAACLHALGESEYRSIRKYGVTKPVAVIPNGVDLPNLNATQIQANWSCHIPREARVLLFLGRIHPKKGLLNLVSAWAELYRKKNLLREPWHLVIAGWDQDGHQADLQRVVADLGVGDRIHFVGPQIGAEKAGSFVRADAFVLPSLSEGLPMAVLEAWSYHLPVLMTPECNLRDGFDAGAAIKMCANIESICRALNTLFAMEDQGRIEMGRCGYGLVQANYSWPSIASQISQIYRWILDSELHPSSLKSD